MGAADRLRTAVIEALCSLAFEDRLEVTALDDDVVLAVVFSMRS